MNNNFTNNLKRLIKKAIRHSCKMCVGENFKEYVPLSELIDYKMNQEEKLKVLICIPLMINEYVQKEYPFVDLSEITTDWTTEQILYAAESLINKIDTVKLDPNIPQYKDNTEALQKIEDIIRTGFNIKRKKDCGTCLYHYAENPNYADVIAQLKDLFKGNLEFKNMEYYTIKELQSRYQNFNKFVKD